jgi:ATP-dependent 26S proteasome regulatory subunit
MRGIDLKKIAAKMNGASGAELKVCMTILVYKACLTKRKIAFRMEQYTVKTLNNFFKHLQKFRILRLLSC